MQLQPLDHARTQINTLKFYRCFFSPSFAIPMVNVKFQIYNSNSPFVSKILPPNLKCQVFEAGWHFLSDLILADGKYRISYLPSIVQYCRSLHIIISSMTKSYFIVHELLIMFLLSCARANLYHYSLLAT